MSATIFHIETGWFALSIVDTAEVGYAADWQAPGGKEVDIIAITDYGSPGGVDSWTCQVTNGALNATPNENTIEVPATFCQPAESIPSPGVTSFALDAEFLQDPNVVDGLSMFLHANDTKEAYFALGLVAEGSPPSAIGRVRVVAGAFGGPARANLVTTVSLPCSGKPDIWFGSASPGAVVKGDGSTYTPVVAAASSSKKDDKSLANA